MKTGAMAHEIFGLPDEMHEILSLAILDAALLFFLPLVLIGYLCWRDKRHASSRVGSLRRRRRRRARSR
jgi:hypothetical protein